MALLALFAPACGKKGLEPGEGYVDVTGGRVWYRIVGSGTQTPLVLLHGGPGAPSYYLNPLAALADERPVVFYDQLGAGRSDRPDDPTLWREDRFVEELAQLREALGLAEIHLLGHSWGTMLAADYLLTEPAGVRSLILSSPALSVTRWMEDAATLKRTLPEEVQATIARHERDGSFDAPEYQAAVLEYYQRYLCRRTPWPADVDRTFEELGTPVYEAMWGPSEFTVTGSLRSFERAESFAEAVRAAKLPVLLTIGDHDEVTPATAEYYQSLIPSAKLEIIENAAHLTMQDAPEAYVQAVRDFLHEVESR